MLRFTVYRHQLALKFEVEYGNGNGIGIGNGTVRKQIHNSLLSVAVTAATTWKMRGCAN